MRLDPSGHEAVGNRPIVMLANGVGHLAASIYLGRPAPGVYSSPLLLLTAGLLLVTPHRLGALAQASGGTTQ